MNFLVLTVHVSACMGLKQNKGRVTQVEALPATTNAECMILVEMNSPPPPPYLQTS